MWFIGIRSSSPARVHDSEPHLKNIEKRNENMKNQYIITSINENRTKLYFLYNYACFSVKSGHTFTNKKKAEKTLNYARKCASSQVVIDNLIVEKI